ncbi:hypothetical protein PLICRDRAFT_421204 [Plicaturopsis crispa FD-325 SS-3]|nr:hypothetical protein PLICRDRAFT_421204 [Plicaturopsis crispa FD-325 SS-3]
MAVMLYLVALLFRHLPCCARAHIDPRLRFSFGQQSRRLVLLCSSQPHRTPPHAHAVSASCNMHMHMILLAPVSFSLSPSPSIILLPKDTGLRSILTPRAVLAVTPILSSPSSPHLLRIPQSLHASLRYEIRYMVL